MIGPGPRQVTQAIKRPLNAGLTISTPSREELTSVTSATRPARSREAVRGAMVLPKVVAGTRIASNENRRCKASMTRAMAAAS
jgi:hypothetical protein